ncbi:MAG TPA: protein kinase, partial [Urbifossiella sp.]|nr:protein kinase [Urbifossiella sp.]
MLIEPLGRGGFGEVWKCEAPGGLHKAVKFVAGCGGDSSDAGNAQLRQEFEAFQQVKAIRHPYLLCLERVELVGNELVMVMGLADCQLGDRYQEHRRAGLPGIPRGELLGYLNEAAEALDVIGTQHGLQHLDVKPANLFLTAGHVQVGDYGLVSKLDGGSANGKNRGLTPKYTAPEVLRGQVHTRSDQYSLALVYQELLTGTFPYPGRTPQQIMMQHVAAAPDLSGLPPQDRAAVGQALAKKPEERFPSCRAFIAALTTTTPPRSAVLVTPQPKPAESAAGEARKLITTPAPGLRMPALVTPAAAAPTGSSETIQLSSIAATAPGPPPSAVGKTPPPRVDPKPAGARGTQLPEILSVLPVEWLRGREAPAPDLPPGDMVRAVLSAATAASKGDPAAVNSRLPDGTWGCRFLTTIDARVAKAKLNILLDQGGVVMDVRVENRVVFRKAAPLPPPQTGLFSFGKKPPPPQLSGLEVVVQLPEPGGAVAEVSAEGRLFGSPPPDFVLGAERDIVSLFQGVRS